MTSDTRITILDLQVQPEERDPSTAPLIDADGMPHWYADADAPSLRESAQFKRWLRHAQSLEAIVAPTERQEEQYDETMVNICCYAMPTVPREVFQGMRPGERSAVLLGFLVHTGMESAAGRAAKAMRDNLTGPPSSPGSNGSTEAR